MKTKIAILLVIFSTHYAFSGWDFNKFPNPDLREYSKYEIELIENLKNEAETFGINICLAVLEAEFKIYNDRYPEYKSVWTEKERRRKWRRHLVKDNKGTNPFCPSFKLGISFRKFKDDLGIKSSFYYCGRFSRDPWSAIEKNLQSTIEEFIDLALIKRYMHLSYFMIYNDGTLISLNPDVEYYLRRIYRVVDPEDEAFRKVDDLLPKLSKERIAFLDDAVRRLDFDAVVETTPPCPPRDNPFTEKSNL